MTELRDSIYYSQLAKQARKLAAAHSNPVVARRLRETAVQHDRLAQKLARAEASIPKPKRTLRSILWMP